MPWEEFSFLFNGRVNSQLRKEHEKIHPGIVSNGDRVKSPAKQYAFLQLSGAQTPILENRGARMIFLPGRTIIRIRSPRLEASSQQDNVGKGSRQNRSVTLGKGLALRAGFGGTFSSGRWKQLKSDCDSLHGESQFVLGCGSLSLGGGPPPYM